MRYLSAVVLAALLGSPALAQKTILDGNSLDDTCRYQRMEDNGVKLSAEEGAKLSFCIGYVRGVLDEIWSQQTIPADLGIKNVGPSKICISNEVSNGQAMKVAIKYLQDHPAKLQFSANYLIRLSMEEAFPCKAPAQR